MISGDLSVFPLLPVLQMLLTSGKSGQFSVDHIRGGELWLEGDEVVHARSGALEGEAALQLLASLDSGLFTFESGVTPPERSLSLKQEAVIRRMFMDSGAWIPLLEGTPDWAAPLRKTSQWNDQQPVTRQHYRLLSLIDSRRSLCDLLDAAAPLNLSPLEVVEAYQTYLETRQLALN